MAMLCTVTLVFAWGVRSLVRARRRQPSDAFLFASFLPFIIACIGGFHAIADFYAGFQVSGGEGIYQEGRSLFCLAGCFNLLVFGAASTGALLTMGLLSFAIYAYRNRKVA